MYKRIITALTLLAALTGVQAQQVIKTEDLNIRDPYIVVDQKAKLYYMYTSRDASVDGQQVGGVAVYTSTDLLTWTGPQQVLALPLDNWSTGHIWAPEVHQYRGKWYAFATVNTGIHWKTAPNGWNYTWRGTQIFRANKPTGPFQAFPSRMPATPMDQMALDGTLWVEDGVPYMVYCHEWIQLQDGAINAVPMKKDLSAPAGQPVRLFHASAAPWSDGKQSKVTDGCFLFRSKTGQLLMVWSSFTGGRYAVGVARSTSGRLMGPWQQQAEPITTTDGGHAMIFVDLQNRLRMVMHSPNSPGGKERAVIYYVEDTGDSLLLHP